MSKQVVFAICGCLLSLLGFPQATTIEGILQQIEQNNKELEAQLHYIESQRQKLKSGNNPPDPRLDAYYLPLGEHHVGDYSEIEISQTLEFPTVYTHRKALINEELARLKLEFRIKRSDILYEAKSLCLQLIFCNKQLQISRQRIKQAKKVYKQTHELFNKGQIGVLDLNKAKLAWLQHQLRNQEFEARRQDLLTRLGSLNAGNSLIFELADYSVTLKPIGRDSIWLERLRQDPSLLKLKQGETVANQRIKLARSQSLPALTIGYNSQGVLGERFSGVYGGISIPVWNRRNTVKAAKANLEFQESVTISSVLLAYKSFEKDFNTYQNRLSQLNEFQKTIAGINNEELLMQSYELGEISFMEYHMELQFYRDAYDAMLDVQHSTYQLRNALLKHQL